MVDHLGLGEEHEKNAERKLRGWWGFFSSKYDASHLYDKAANQFKLANACEFSGKEQEGHMCKLADCCLKTESKHEAANAFASAGHCFKKTSIKDAITCLGQAIDAFLEEGRISMAAKYEMEIAVIYEQEQKAEKASVHFKKAAELYQAEDGTSKANECNLKVAQLGAQLEQYQKAIDIFEEIARRSVSNNQLKYGVRGYLLNAGLCELCKGDTVAIANALERYQELDPSFSGTREYKFLQDMASAIDDDDVAKFTNVVKEFDSMTSLDPWKTSLLLRTKEALRAKEMEEDDLT